MECGETAVWGTPLAHIPVCPERLQGTAMKVGLVSEARLQLGCSGLGQHESNDMNAPRSLGALPGRYLQEAHLPDFPVF